MNRLTRLSMILVSTIPMTMMAQETFGLVSGVARTSDGRLLSGATVRLTGSALQGTRTAITDAEGFYRLPLIPPGRGYTVEFTKDGYTTVKKSMDLGLGQSVSVDAIFTSIAEATVEVTSGTKKIDKSDVKSATNLTAADFDLLPRTNKSLQGAALLAPGVTAGYSSGSRVSIRGQLGLGNRYTLNGVPIEDNIFGGTAGSNGFFIDDSIAEIQILQSPSNAKYGGFSGGVIQAISKTGGNEYTGILRGNFSRNSWNSLNPLGQRTTINSSNTYPTTTDVTSIAYTLFLGGPIIKDRLWFTFSTILTPGSVSTDFFNTQTTSLGLTGSTWAGVPGTYLAAQQASTGNTSAYGRLFKTGTAGLGGVDGRAYYPTSAGQPFSTVRSQQYYETKITFAISPDHSIEVSGNRNTTNVGPYKTTASTVTFDSEGLGFQKAINEYETLGYSGILSSNTTLELRYGRKLQNLLGGGVRSTYLGEPLYQVRSVYSNGATTRDYTATFDGGDGGDQRNSKIYSGNLSHYGLQLFGANHTIDLGFEYQTQSRSATNYQAPYGKFMVGMGRNIDGTHVVVAGGGRKYDPATGTYDMSTTGQLPWSIGNFNYTYMLDEFGSTEFSDDTMNGFYLNDLMVFNKNHQIMWGLRYDINTLTNTFGAQISDPIKEFSPRFQYRYDVKGDQTWVWTFNYNKYVQRVPTGISNLFTLTGNPDRVYWAFRPDAAGITYFSPFQAGQAFESVRFANVTRAQMTNINNWDRTNRGFLLYSGGQNRRILNPSAPISIEKSIGIKHNMDNGFWSVTLVQRDTDNVMTNYNTFANGLAFNEQTVSVPVINSLQGAVRQNWTKNADTFRTYKGLEFEFAFNLSPRFTFSGNWTYSKLTGNAEGSGIEGGGNSPVGDYTILGWYEDIHQLEGRNRNAYAPVGYLAEDLRNKGTLVFAYGTSTAPQNNFSVSLLMNYFAGAPYSLTNSHLWGVQNYAATLGSVIPGTSVARSPILSSYPTQYTKYWSGRGVGRFNDNYNFDLKIYTDYPIDKKVRMFTELTALNVFNHFIQTSWAFSQFSTTNRPTNTFSDSSPLAAPSFLGPSGSLTGGVNPTGFGSYGASNYSGARAIRLSVGFKW
jgi:hypothetical protein